MLLFENPLFKVSQGVFTGWKIQSCMSGAIYVPDRVLKEKIGLVWMKVRKTKRGMSIDSAMSEEVMFGSFAHAVSDPASDEGSMWRTKNAEELANFFIDLGNRYMRGEA